MGQLESLRELSIAQPTQKKKKKFALVFSIDRDSNDF
jgi:hypothetical protein